MCYGPSEENLAVVESIQKGTKRKEFKKIERVDRVSRY